MIRINLLKNRKKNQYKCGGLTIKIVEADSELLSAKWVRMKVFQIEQGIKITEDFDRKDPESVHIVAYLSEMPVGAARIRLFDDGFGKIERVAVLKEFRKRGIGKQILKYVVESLKNERMKIAILTSRETTKKFYSQSGFAESATIIDERGIRHILMMKIL